MEHLRFQRLGKSAVLPRDVLIQTAFECFFLYGKVTLYKTFHHVAAPEVKKGKKLKAQKAEKSLKSMNLVKHLISMYPGYQIPSIQVQFKVQNMYPWLLKVSMFCQPRIQLEMGRWEIMETSSEFGTILLQDSTDGLCAMLGFDYLDSSLKMSLAHFLQGISRIIVSQQVKATGLQETKGSKFATMVLET